MRPQDRLSPRNRLSNLVIIHCAPEWSIGKFTWDDEPECYGICWNGDLNNPNDKGNPRSHGEGTWFVLPDAVAGLVKLARIILDVMCKYEHQQARDSVS